MVCYTVLNNGETVATSGKRKESETISAEREDMR
jgi:hypothetical protein